MARRWSYDWAGPHGTFGGTISGLLAAASLPWLTRVTTTILEVPHHNVVLGSAGATATSVVVVLAWGAVRSAPTATTVYRLAVVGGSFAWATAMLAAETWEPVWWAQRFAALAVGALGAGVIAAMVKDRPEKPVDTSPEAVAEAERLAAGYARDDLAAEWVDRIARVCNITVKVPNIQTWAGRTPDGDPTGYTVEAICPAGGASWRTIKQYEQPLGADLDLPRGCNVDVQGGSTRRTTLIKVATVNLLATENRYPTDCEPLTINGPLPVGCEGDGTVVGPVIRHMSVGIYGQKGSGKTNSSHVLTGGVARCVDALQWDVELAGGGLSRPWIHSYLNGETTQPAIDWVAFTEQEGEFMLRAAQRVTYRRKDVYLDTMMDVDDDKMPCSPDLPAIVVRHDEIAKTMGARSERPILRDLIKNGVFEGRASAVNYVLVGLEATAGIIDQDTHRQLGVIAAMRATNEATYAWAFGRWDHGITTDDIPYPGNAGISLETGELPVKMCWYRIVPSTIKEICKATDGRHPALDEPSRLAADGRNPDGSPMSDLLPGELDCYTTRWDRYRSTAGITTAPKKGTPMEQHRQPQTRTVADAMGRLADAEAAMLRAAAEAQGLNPDEQLEPSCDWDAAFIEMTGDAEPATPAPSAKPTDRETVIGLVPEEGIDAGDLLDLIRDRGVNVVRSTVYQWLKEEPTVEWRPSREGGKRGRWYRVGGAS